MKEDSKRHQTSEENKGLDAFTFKCIECGKEHKGDPSFSYAAPAYYSALSEEDQNSLGQLNSDLCTISPDDYFIRVILEIPIIDYPIPFTWGVWVSQSKTNFEWYVDNFNADNSGYQSFGWFCNTLPYYPDTINLQTVAHFQVPGQRPRIELKEVDHELYQDFANGISRSKAYQIAQRALHGAN